MKQVIIRKYPDGEVVIIEPYLYKGMFSCQCFDGCFGDCDYNIILKTTKPCKIEEEYRHILNMWVGRCKEAEDLEEYKIVQKINYKNLNECNTIYLSINL